MAKPSNRFSRFKKAEDPLIPRIIAASAGEPGSRKTSFWLEAPAPIVLHSMDRGLEGVVQRYQEIKDIYFKEYDWSVQGDDPVQAAKDTWEEFFENYKESIELCKSTSDRRSGTVVLDKEPDFWLLNRFASGLTGGDNQKDYAEANSKMRELVNLAKQSDVNLGFIQGLKDKWGKVVSKAGHSSQGPTGERVPAGFKEIEGLVHMVLLHKGLSLDTWSITVGKVRGPGAMELAEQEFTYNMVPSFTDFAQLVFPDTLESDWL